MFVLVSIEKVIIRKAITHVNRTLRRRIKCHPESWKIKGLFGFLEKN